MSVVETLEKRVYIGIEKCIWIKCAKKCIMVKKFITI